MFKLESWSPSALAALRIVTGLLFLEEGLVKLAQFPAASPNEPSPLPPLLVVAGCLEVVGGSLITAGLFTRAVAFILSGEMAVAYFRVHAPKSFWPILNHGDMAIMFCFVFLYLVFAGPGAWSLDGAVGASRARRATVRRA
jgi:putative oxidoreductase